MRKDEPLTEEEIPDQTEPEQEYTEEAPTGRGRSKVLQRILAGVLTLLLIVLAALVFVFRDTLSAAGLRKLFGRETALTETREAFTYETGANQVFAAAGNGLAVASSSSLQLLSASGEIVFKQVVSYDSPAVIGTEAGALFCELNGTHAVYALLSGESRDLRTDGTILTANMNENGWFCLVTSEPGYKALVSVYNSDCEKQYEWWSGTGYVLRAAVSPDNRSLAVLCAERDCTKLHIFSLNSEEERGGAVIDNALYFDLGWLGGDTICAVGETGLRFFSAAGTQTGAYALDGQYLLDYALSRSGFAAVYVSAYRSGAGGTLLTLNGDGKVLGTAALERDVVSLSTEGRQLLVMTAGALTLYNQDLARQSADETLMTAKRAILRPSGDILLLHAYSAERFSF